MNADIALLEDFYDAMVEELERAEKKWPDKSIEVRALALSGEAGECSQAVIKGESPDRIRTEAVQAAVTAFRLYRMAQ